MSSRGRRAFHRGSVGRGSERGSPDSANSSNPHSGDSPQVGGGAEHFQYAWGRGRGGRGTHNPRGGHTRGRGSGSVSMVTRPQRYLYSITNIAPEPHVQQANVNAPIADDSGKQVVNARQKTQGLTSNGLPLRPDFGMNGRQITLNTNFFPVRVPKGLLYEYFLETTPRLAQRRIIRRVLCLAEQTAAWTEAGMHGNVAHDGYMRLVSAIRLPQPLTIVVPYYVEGETSPAEEGGRVYTLSISLIQELNMEHLASYIAGEPNFRDYDAFPALVALNTILKSIPTRVDIMVGRRYFSVASAEITGLGGGLEAWRGFQLMLKPVHKQLMVNVGVCTTVFHTPGNLAHAMIEFDRSSFGALTGAFLKGVKIRTTHLEHRKTIKRVLPLTASSFSFDTPRYGRVTLEDYFRQKYSIRLRYHDMPLIDVGGNDKTNYLPAEVCDILSGQCFHEVLVGEQAAAMTSMGRRSPNENKIAIVNHVRDQLSLDVTRPELRSFGMTVGQDMAIVQGRIFPKPGIEYLSGSALINDRASWNLKGVKFAVGARLENWAVLVIKDGSPDEYSGSEDEDLRWVVARFCDMCHVSGMHVADDPKYVTAQLPQRDPTDSLRQMALQKIRSALLSVNPKPAVFLAILANGDKEVYAGLKHLCDVFLDVATVCVQSSKFRRNNLHYLANVALKMNMKLGGINHKLDPGSRAWLSSASTMIVGIHVNHPGPGSAAGTPSIVAVVSSIDDNFGQYPAKLEIQRAKMEMVTDLKSVMIDRLKLFQAENKGKLPERIIVYRSGLLAHQSDQVTSIELPQIFEALSDRPSRPKIALIICDKRNQVRFYPTDINSAEGAGNPFPGTVVDRNITDIYGFDFFLQSHDALSGTARPIHYTVIHDEIGFRADELQGVTHSLSYMFARTTKSVRLASPASYAELASRRGRCYLHTLALRVMLVGGEIRAEDAEKGVWQEAQKLWGRGVSGAGLKNTMFYL